MNIYQVGNTPQFYYTWKSDQEQDIDYNSKMVMIMAELISDIITKVTPEVDNFGQQCILQQGMN